MYVELKSGHAGDGPAWVGRVTLSKTGRTLTYRGMRLEKVDGILGNYRDMDSGDEYWISNVKRGRHQRQAAGVGPVEIDEDAREEFERLTGGG